MNHISQIGYARAGWFGQRKLTPRACIADSKKHLRTFLADALEDLGFITCECGQAGELDAVLDAERPDLLVLSVSVDGIEVSKILETLVRKDYGGRVLVIGQPDSIMVKAVRQIGDEYVSRCCLRCRRRSVPQPSVTASCRCCRLNLRRAPQSTCPKR